MNASPSTPARVRVLAGLSRRLFDLRLFFDLTVEGVRRFGLIGVLREVLSCFRDPRNLLSGSGAHYLVRGREVYAASALPSLRSPGFRRYLLDEIASFNRKEIAPLAWVMLSVSSRCPYRCRYCYALDDLAGEPTEGRERLEVDTLREALIEIGRMGVPTVFLTGGEPMSRKQELVGLLASVREVLVAAAPAAWLVTTGWDVDEAFLGSMAEHGLVGLVVSLDSREEADVIRSKGHPEAWRRALGALAAARASGLLIGVDTMVPKGSPLLRREQFDAFVDFLQELGVHFLNLFPPHPVGGARRAGLLPLSVEEIDLLEGHTVANNRRAGRPLAYTAIAWERRRGCSGGQRFVYVDPEGRVRPCPFLSFSAGNIREEPLSRIVARVRAAGEQEGCFHAVPGLLSERRTDEAG
jgi:MoaA/NifB/PqqE/SkfB family radical SAM enzyme